MDTQEYLTPAQAAELSGAPGAYIYSLICAHVLESRLQAGRRFILRSSFERWNLQYQIRRHIKRSPGGSGAASQEVSP